VAGVKPQCYRVGCKERVVLHTPERAYCGNHAAADLMEAMGLLSDYARIYPNNSGRTIRFLNRLGVPIE